jgi:hypothetical protein
VLRVNDAHTELSAIFGQQWLFTQRGSGKFWLDSALYAEANIAFNYANLTLGIDGRFVALAESLVNAEQRISNKELKAGLKYGLEICPVECDSWFEFFFVPSIWSHYSFDISEIYNNNPELKNINFQTENNDKLFEIIESKYSIWKGASGD